MLTTLNDRTHPFRFKGDTRLLRVRLDLITVPGSARVLDSQGITDIVSGVLIEPISRKFPAIGLLRWLDVNGRVQGEELRLEFEQTDFYPTVASISGFELWFRKGVMLNVSIENGGGSVGDTDYSGALATLQSTLDAVGVTVDNLAMAVINGGTDNAPVLAAIANLQQTIDALPEQTTGTDYSAVLNSIAATVDQILPMVQALAPTTPPAPVMRFPGFLPYVITPLKAHTFYSAETGLSALNDGNPDTGQTLTTQRGPQGMICFSGPVLIALTFQAVVRLTRVRILCGQFNGSGSNLPSGFTLYKGNSTSQPIYSFTTGFNGGDGLAFREFDLTANASTDSVFRLDFFGGSNISVYEMQFWGVTV